MGAIQVLKLNKYFKHFLLVLLVLAITACEDTKNKEIIKNPIISTYYLIRHSEKDRTNPDNLDPEKKILILNITSLT